MNELTDNNTRGSEEDFAPIRQKVDVQIGSFVQSDGKIYQLVQVLDFQSVIGVETETGRSTLLRIQDLRRIEATLRPSVDLSEVTDEDWRIAESRFAAIKPLLDLDSPGRAAVERRAKEVGVDAATLYRWLQRHAAYDSATALIPQKRGWKTGRGRIDVFAEEVIQEVIKDYYLTSQRSTVGKTITEVQRRCLQRGITAPSPSTIRSRISRIPERERLRGRGYRERAKNKFLPAAGSFPNADFPLAVVQIDHTPADIILVDDVYRKPIGRPWITLAMDIHSRMVTGYYP